MRRTSNPGLKVGLIALLLLISVFSVFMLTACGDNIVVTELAVVEGTVPDVAVAGAFKISDVRLSVTTDDGNVREIAAESGMLTTEGRAALSTPGQQNVTLFYKQHTVVISVLVVEEGTETVKVTFVDADSKTIASKSVVKGASVSAPNPPDVDGKVFVGWVTGGGVPVDLSAVEADMTVYASYAANAAEYTVRFVDYKGNTVATQTVRHGDKITPPAWTKPSELADYNWGVDFSTYTVTNNAVISMTVTYVERTVEYGYAFESKPDVFYSINLVEYVKVGGTATMRNTAVNRLTQMGLNFIEWQNASSVINVNTRMVATVSDRNFTISYKYGDSSTVSLLAGTALILPISALPKTGYTFNNQWKDADGNVYSGSLVVSKNLVLEPVYNKKPAPISIEFTFKEFISEQGIVRKEIVHIDDTFYGDRIDLAYIERVFAAVKAADARLSGYEIEAVFFGEEDITAAGTVLGEVVGNGVHSFFVDAVDSERETAGLKWEINNGAYTVTGYDGISTSVYIPAEKDGHPVTAIGAEAFKDKVLFRLVIPSSVKSIGDGAFAGATFYEDIVLPDLEAFGSGVFVEASSGEVTADDGEPAIKDLKVVFGAGSTFTTLDGNTFNNSKGLSYIELPESVTEITDRDCPESDGDYDSILEINLDKVTDIGAYAFYRSTVESAGSLASVLSVGKYAFYGSRLAALDLPSVKTVGEFAFASMPRLTELTLATDTVFETGEAAIEFDLAWIDGDAELISLTLGRGVTRLMLTAVATDGTTANLRAAVSLPKLAVIDLPSGLSSAGTYYKTSADQNAQEADEKYGLFSAIASLREINVAPGGEKFLSDGGVLYEINVVSEEEAEFMPGYKAGDKVVYMVAYPGGKTGDYTVPDVLAGADVVGLFADFGCVSINTLTVNANFVETLIAAEGAFDVSGTGSNNVVNLVIDGALLGEGEAFVKNIGYIFSAFGVARFYFVSSPAEGFDDLVQTNSWQDKLFAYDAQSLSRYDSASKLAYKVTDGKAVVLFGDRNAAEITVPARLGGVPVAEIAVGAFANYANLTKLSILATLDGFAAGILTNACALAEISVAGWSAGAKVDAAAFDDTAWAKGRNLLVLGGKLIKYNSFTENETTGISAVVTAEDLAGVTSIPAEFFKDSNIREIAFPAGLTAIGASAFENSALEAIDFGAVRELGDKAFYDCKKLATADLTSVVRMGREVFANCVLLTAVTIPNEVNSGYLPYGTFSGCAALIGVAMPYIIGLSQDESGASAAFSGCTALENIDFANSFASIPGFAFTNCASLRKVDFTAMAATEIGANAFAGCESLEIVVLSSNITSLGSAAFYACNNLVSVRIQGNGGILSFAEPVPQYVFPNGNVNYTIYVSAGANAAALSNYSSKVKNVYPVVSFAMYPNYAASGSLDMAGLIDTIYMEEAPAAPEFEGYVFDAWYLYSGSRYVEAEFPYNVTADVTFYAKYFSAERGSLVDSDVAFDESTQSYSVINYAGTTDDTVYIPAYFRGSQGLYPVYTVYAGAFANCTNLTALELPEGIRFIKAGVPSNESTAPNAALRSVFIPSTVESVEAGALANLNDLDIDFAPGSMLKDADKTAFVGSKWYIEQLESASQGRNNGFVIAGRLAIEYAGESKQAELPADLYKLADELFKDNGDIEEVIINDALAYIGDRCFENASKLRYVTYASGVGGNVNSALVYANINAFAGTPWFAGQNMVIVGTILVKYNDLSGDSLVSIPDYVTEISDNAFASGEVRTIIFGENSALKSIGNGAFANSKLTQVTLPAVTFLGTGVFENCRALESADLSKAEIEVLPVNTFKGASKLKTLVLPASVTGLGSGSLTGCSALVDITADGITDTANLALGSNESGSGLADTAFYKQTAQDTAVYIVLGKVLVKYLPGAASNEETEIIAEIPEGVEIILSKVFAGSAVEIAYIPETVRIIEENAFASCTVLREVVFHGAGLTEIADNAFVSCAKLATIVLPETLEIIGSGAFSGTALTEIELPDSVTSVGGKAFYNISSLEFVKLGAGISFIGKEAFASCVNLYKVSWSATSESLDELNANIHAFIEANVETYAHSEFEAYINGLFARQTEGRALRVYLYRDLWSYITNSVSTSTNVPEREAAAWNGNGTGFKLYAEGDYPLVSFESDKGYYMASFEAEIIESVGVPAKTGHTFMGWYLDASYTIPLELPYPVYKDMTLYAKWFKNDIDSSTGSNVLSFVKDNVKDSYTVSAVNTSNDILYIPSTVEGSPVGNIQLTQNAVGIKKLVLTNASAFSGLTENIFRYFPDLEEIELLSNDDVAADMSVADGVLYSSDGAELIAYLARYETDEEGGKTEISDFAIPDGVVAVLPYAFANAPLKSVSVSAGVRSVGLHAFNDGLEAVNFPAAINITDADSRSFDNTEWYSSAAKTPYMVGGATVGFFYSAGNILLRYEQISVTPNLVIPDVLNDFNISVLASYLNAEARDDSTKMEFSNMTLPTYLVKINERALAGIDVAVNISTRSAILTDIAADVFADTAFYKNNNSDMLILGRVLLKCVTTSPNIEVPEGIVAISNDAFTSSQVRNITLPASLAYIGDRAFYNCSNLVSVNIPDNVKEIGDSAFAICKSLVTVGFNAATSKLTSVGASAFSACDKLTAIDLPYTVETVGAEAFLNCTGLASVNFDYIETVTGTDGAVSTVVREKSRMTELGARAFYNCRGLISVNLPDGISAVKEQTFYNCTSLLTVKFDVERSRVRIIEQEAFYNCVSLGGRVDVAAPDLVTVVLPNSLETLSKNAFAYCSSLLGIRLNYNVKTIETHVFSGCVRLTKIDVYNATPPAVETGAFDRAIAEVVPYYNLRIYVNHSTGGTVKKNYKEAGNWSAYANCIYERSELPLLTFRRVTTGGTGQIVDESDPISADIIVNPTYQWGNTTYSIWTYTTLASVTYDEAGTPTGTANNTIDPRYEKRITDFSYQVQSENGQNYTLLVLDYDYVTVTTAS